MKKPGGQQQRAGDHQAEALEHLGDRQRPSASWRCARLSTLKPWAQHPGADHRGQHDQRQGRAEPEPAADLDQQRDLRQRHDDERRQQNEAEPGAGRGLFFRPHYMIV